MVYRNLLAHTYQQKYYANAEPMDLPETKFNINTCARRMTNPFYLNSILQYQKSAQIQPPQRYPFIASAQHLNQEGVNTKPTLGSHRGQGNSIHPTLSRLEVLQNFISLLR